MPRNKQFSSPGRSAPFQADGRLRLDEETVSGPLSFFNPTAARFHVNQASPAGESTPDSELRAGTQAVVPGAQVYWRARDNRKGRHPLVLDAEQLRQGVTLTNSTRAVISGIARMFTVCPYWDVSYLVAVFFTVGCLVFIVCGLFAWLPIAYPDSAFPGESSVASGVTAFVGATLFQIGAVLLVFEACNENRTGCFGWALHRALSGREEADTTGEQGPLLTKTGSDQCRHHHQQRPLSKAGDAPQGERAWEWWPTWREFKHHYIHELGFVASTSLAIGATIFYVSGIMALPGIYDKLSIGVIQGVYLFTYLFGGVIFVFSSVLYMLETQPNWYTPAPHLLGWHIGLWNLIGSIGWTLAASFGYCTADWCSYQSELTLIWASVAFFIGSALLWYEALDKYPVEKAGKAF